MYSMYDIVLISNVSDFVEMLAIESITNIPFGTISIFNFINTKDILVFHFMTPLNQTFFIIIIIPFYYYYS